MNIRQITVSVVPHKEQSYNTVGDWQINHYEGEDCLDITVSDLGDWRYTMAVAVHEVLEGLLCAEHGVTPKSVDTFDMKFEDKRKKGDTAEPGDDPKAPYHLEHGFASACERMFIAACGLNWKKYTEAVDEA